jgi:hypothetical protein
MLKHCGLLCGKPHHSVIRSPTTSLQFRPQPEGRGAEALSPSLCGGLDETLGERERPQTQLSEHRTAVRVLGLQRTKPSVSPDRRTAWGQGLSPPALRLGSNL